ncbi:MAG TPA: methionine biosynthesis protein MetW [Terriglobales bacterium]|nr:methionine biosynthesis protein MetW [Terriglobales bacterium]
MASNGAPNPSEVIARIRERVRQRHAGEPELPAPRASLPPSLGPATPGFDFHELHVNLAASNALHAAVGTLNPRRPGLHNQAIQFVKKLMRRSLTWYTRPLHEFHGAVTRTLNETTKCLQDLQARLGALEHAFETVHKLTLAHADAVTALQRDLRRLREEIQQGEQRPPARAEAISGGQAASAAAPELDFDYFMFEERFRGPESEIKRRQQSYLEYFRGRENVLDLGCGRGEFLELMRENGIPAQGVETGKDALLLCRDKGLSVSEADLLSYLQAMADESAGGMFSSQVIEHMPPAAQMQFTRLTHQKLRPGSPLVIETINPECVYALCRNYYLDPTHVRPVHPEMLAFVLRSLGFSNVEIKYSSPVSDRQVPPLRIGEPGPELTSFNQAMGHVNQLLFGFQDYAVVGWK